MAAINCVVVTPEATTVNTTAEFIALTLYDGELGIAPGHSPLIGRLGFGELRIRSGGDVQRYYVDGGFVQVADNSVSVLTNRALPADKVDTAAAKKQIEAALKLPTHTDDLAQIRDRQLSQARGQLQVARRSR